jgi:hypothetical protein
VTVTHLDGIVYARSVFHHSANYRSVVVHGRAHEVPEDEKLHALRVLTEHLAPGSWDHARPPADKELAKTIVLALDLTEASAKIRSGPPSDDQEDMDADIAWAGVLPLTQQWGTPQPSPDLPPGWDVPAHVTGRTASRD